MRSDPKGFTMVELIAVIMVVGILAVFAIPRWFTSLNEAYRLGGLGVTDSVRTGINSWNTNYRISGGADAYPISLDSEPLGPCTNCFVNVMTTNPVSDVQWVKVGANTYQHDDGSGVIVSYTYDSTTGTFQ